MKIIHLFFFCWLLSPLFNNAIGADERWFNDVQVQQGKVIFLQHCAVCHGKNAEATSNWKERDKNGFFPPPPLDGSAHAWHHSLETLRTYVKNGGLHLGGQMPAMGTILNTLQIDAAIAYFQSKWPSSTYQTWHQRYILPINKPIQPILQALQNKLPKSTLSTPKAVANGQLLRVDADGKILFLTPDGEYVINGKIIHLKTGQSLID